MKTLGYKTLKLQDCEVILIVLDRRTQCKQIKNVKIDLKQQGLSNMQVMDVLPSMNIENIKCLRTHMALKTISSCVKPNSKS